MIDVLEYKKYQDVHNKDRELWTNFYKDCSDGKYNEAQTRYTNYFNNDSSISSKRFMAEYYNICARNLTKLQGKDFDDPTFKQDKIKVSKTPPEQMTTGQIYFKIEEE